MGNNLDDATFSDKDLEEIPFSGPSSIRPVAPLAGPLGQLKWVEYRTECFTRIDAHPKWENK
jgi:hypothetical protein